MFGVVPTPAALDEMQRPRRVSQRIRCLVVLQVASLAPGQPAANARALRFFHEPLRTLPVHINDSLAPRTAVCCLLSANHAAYNPNRTFTFVSSHPSLLFAFLPFSLQQATPLRYAKNLQSEKCILQAVSSSSIHPFIFTHKPSDLFVLYILHYLSYFSINIFQYSKLFIFLLANSSVARGDS